MKYILTISLLLIGSIAFGQNECEECDKFKIAGLYDFGPPPGGNWVILLLTVTEDLASSFDPHYSDLYFVSSDGDTITKPLGASHTLPQLKYDTIPFLMELNTELSNQNFPIDFNGKLVIRTPTGGPCPNVTWCNIDYSIVPTNINETPFQDLTSTIYPNPTTNEIRIDSAKDVRIVNVFSSMGKLLKTKNNYKNEEAIDLIGIEKGVIMIQLIYEDNTIETHPLVIIK